MFDTPTAPTLADRLRVLIAEGLEASEARNIFAEPQQEPFADYIAAARAAFATDQVEIDDTPEISEADAGCWVAGWVWVTNEMAGVIGDDDAEDPAEAGS